MWFTKYLPLETVDHNGGVSPSDTEESIGEII